jgi:hypothetical protein
MKIFDGNLRKLKKQKRVANATLFLGARNGTMLLHFSRQKKAFYCYAFKSASVTG